MADRTIPLFPLNLVLFPGALLPLHIFEARYRKMVADCLESGDPMGIVLGPDQNPRNVGCTARIKQVFKEYDDGRLDIMTQGDRRFSISEINFREAPYIQAEVEWLTSTVQDGDFEGAAQLKNLYQEFSKYANNGPDLALDIEKDPEKITFLIAQSLGLYIEVQQSLLELSSTSERIEELSRMVGSGPQ